MQNSDLKFLHICNEELSNFLPFQNLDNLKKWAHFYLLLRKNGKDQKSRRTHQCNVKWSQETTHLCIFVLKHYKSRHGFLMFWSNRKVRFLWLIQDERWGRVLNWPIHLMSRHIIDNILPQHNLSFQVSRFGSFPLL